MDSLQAGARIRSLACTRSLWITGSSVSGLRPGQLR